MTDERYLKMARGLEVWKCLAFDLTDVPMLEKAIAAALQKAAEEATAEYRAWHRAANKFMWAHEHDCPRRDGISTCTCGLDTFLARPRLYMETVESDTEKREQKAAEDEREACEAIAKRWAEETGVVGDRIYRNGWKACGKLIESEIRARGEVKQNAERR